jgi:peptidoglycan/LPS O-acetylase OafA/YrhL
MPPQLFYSLRNQLRELRQPIAGQNPVLDGIRALSVLTVIAFHVLFGLTKVVGGSRLSQWMQELPPWTRMLWHGEKGVDAFLILTGIVLGLPLFRALERQGTLAIRRFYEKRFFRIYPLFFLALVLYTAGQFKSFGSYFWSNLFFLNHLIPGQRSIIPVGWSLNVEVQLYVLLPFVLLALFRARFLFGGLLALFLGSITITGVILYQHPELYQRPLPDLLFAPDHAHFASQLGSTLYEAFLARFGPFFLGVWIAYVQTHHAASLNRWFSQRGFRAFTFLVAIACLLGVCSLPLYEPQSWLYQPQHSPWIQFGVLTLMRPVFSLGLGLLILGCSTDSPTARGFPLQLLHRFFAHPAWLPISRLAFPIYLFHFPWIAAAAALVFRTIHFKEVTQVTSLHGFLIFILATLFTTLFSIPLHFWIERPFMRRASKTAPTEVLERIRISR